MRYAHSRTGAWTLSNKRSDHNDTLSNLYLKMEQGLKGNVALASHLLLQICAITRAAKMNE